MRFSSRLRTATLSAVAVSGALVLLGAVRPVAAQTISLPDNSNTPVAVVRADLYFPFNSLIKNDVGKTFYGGGLDYIIQRQQSEGKTELSVDYIERSSGGNDARIIPVTIGEFTFGNPSGNTRPYFGIGAGAYFIHQKGPDNTGLEQSQDKTAVGGYFAAGLNLPDNFILEARYHLIQKVGIYNSSGLQVSAGFRF